MFVLLIGDVIFIIVMGIYIYCRKNGKPSLIYSDYSLLADIADDAVRKKFMLRSSLLFAFTLFLDLVIIHILVIFDIRSVPINIVCYLLMILLIAGYCILYKRMYQKLKTKR